MKKTLFSIILTIALSIPLFAQEWVNVTSEKPSTIEASLIKSTESSIIVNVQVPGFYSDMVSTPRGEAHIVSIPKTISTSEAGEPFLPTYAIPVIIPDNALMKIRVLDASYVEYKDYDIAPSKGDFPRTINPDDVPYTYGTAYATDAFFPTTSVNMYSPYILRDFRGQNMVLYPFAYNPISKTLRVYYNMTVEMYNVGVGGENQITRKSSQIALDPEIGAIYEDQFINYGASMAKYTAIDETGDLLIICHDAFMNAMQPFVNWKKQIGRPTTIVGTSTAGTTDSAIKNYIQSQYTSNPNITHVLLVGDVAQIPGHSYSCSSYSGKSDNWYGQVAGDDYYNDIYVGRFSAENTDHVTTQVNKVIHYERDITASDTWLTTGGGVAAYAGGGGHFGEDDWEHINNIRTDLMNYHYTTVHQDYQSVTGYTGSAALLSQHINAGLSIINYCNHGSETSWGVFNYSNSNVNALTNVNMLPIVWSVACLNGKYDYGQPCFGETWLRANNGTNDTPTGAIGGMFSYISQPWIPPMYGQDEMVDVLVESYTNNIKRTLGGTSTCGNMKILDQYGSSAGQGLGTYMAWILFGDPTLTLRNAVAANMGVTHSSTMNTTATSFTVNATAGNGALATLTRNNEIMGSATITNGTANITFTAPGTQGTATLTVFGYNKITYVGTVTITSGGAPDPISVQASAAQSIIAQGGSTTMTATATGGSGSYTYTWSPTTGLNNANIQSPIASPTQTTTYTCTVSDGSLSGSGTVTITVVVPPTNLTATVVNNSSIRLNWSAASPVTSYKVYRGDSMIAQNITGNSYIDNNLAAGTYCYSVSTVYSGIESPQTEEVCGTILAPLSLTITTLSSVIPAGGSTTLNAHPVGGSGSYSYSWTPSASLNNAHIQSPIATPTQTTTYTCTVSDGNNSANATITITVVTAPTGISTAIVDVKNIDINWNAATTASSYKLYRNDALIASGITSTSYSDTNLEEGSYCYKVSAVYQNVESPKSSESCQTIYYCAAPADLEGSYYYENEAFGVMLDWNKVAINNPLTEFRIYRSTSNADYQLVGTVSNDPTLTHYTFMDEVPVGTYYYKVSAYYSLTDCENFYQDNSGTDYIVVQVTSLDETYANVKVYPNPTKDVINIEGEDLRSISIVNMFGQTIYQAKVEGQKAVIDMTQYATGIYTMQVKTLNGTAMRQVVVK